METDIINGRELFVTDISFERAYFGRAEVCADDLEGEWARLSSAVEAAGGILTGRSITATFGRKNDGGRIIADIDIWIEVENDAGEAEGFYKKPLFVKNAVCTELENEKDDLLCAEDTVASYILEKHLVASTPAFLLQDDNSGKVHLIVGTDGKRKTKATFV